MEINLDEARAARAEATGEPKTLRFGGEVFALPDACPLGVIEHFANYYKHTRSEGRGEKGAAAMALTDLFAAGETLLGSDGWARFKGHGADFDDVLSLVVGGMRLYRIGESLGEADSSGSSSSEDGESSRATSNGSTGSTSDEHYPPIPDVEVPSPSDVSAS